MSKSGQSVEGLEAMVEAMTSQLAAAADNVQRLEVMVQDLQRALREEREKTDGVAEQIPRAFLWNGGKPVPLPEAMKAFRQAAQVAYEASRGMGIFEIQSLLDVTRFLRANNIWAAMKSAADVAGSPVAGRVLNGCYHPEKW